MLDATSKQNPKGFEQDKQSKNTQLSKRGTDLFEFIQDIVKDIMENEVLYPAAAYFVPKKAHLEEMNRKKQEQKY